MDNIILRVAFKFQPKEKKQNKVDRLMKEIREATGISRSQAEDIADAIIRNREIERLAIQKGWPVEDGQIVGPNGSINLRQLQNSRTASLEDRINYADEAQKPAQELLEMLSEHRDDLKEVVRFAETLVDELSNLSSVETLEDFDRGLESSLNHAEKLKAAIEAKTNEVKRNKGDYDDPKALLDKLRGALRDLKGVVREIHELEE